MMMWNHDHDRGIFFPIFCGAFFLLMVGSMVCSTGLYAQDSHTPIGTVPDVTPTANLPNPPIAASLDSMDELNDHSIMETQ